MFRFKRKLVEWMLAEGKTEKLPICDYDRICYEIRPCDILLVEGHSRISNTIRLLTHSNWTHACIYIGKLKNIENRQLYQHIKNNYNGNSNEPLIIESFLGRGTTINPLSKYRQHHVRICRPIGISPQDAKSVIEYCIYAIGYDYNTRQIFDMMRFLFPITFIPRKLFSSLFCLDEKDNTHKICSSLLAEAFQSVSFPVLPKILINEQHQIELVPRNPKLFTPGDFDYSPYFEIIKYPLFGMTEATSIYKQLPWNRSGIFSNDAAGLYETKAPAKEE